MVNLSYNKNRLLPSAEELPCSDETPVDKQLQNDIPNLLLSLLAFIGMGRDDWYFGVDMGIYYDPDEPAIILDGFLAVGVKHDVLWEEAYIRPILDLEVISEQYNREYEGRLADYQTLGILYYAIYNPLSGRRRRFKTECLTQVSETLEIAWKEKKVAGYGMLRLTEHQRTSHVNHYQSLCSTTFFTVSTQPMARPATPQGISLDGHSSNL